MTLHTEAADGGLTIEIDHDYDCPSPRDDDVPGCQLVMWGRNWNFPNDAGIDIGDFTGWPQVEAHLLNEGTVLYSQPVWVYEHSGIAFSTGERTYPFDDRWDSAQCGVAYVTAENWKECQGTEWAGSDEQKAIAAQMIKGDVELYGWYVNGETYAFCITDASGDVIDSCAGYLGWEAVEEAAREAAEAALEG